LFALYPRDDFGGSVLHSFCPRPPKTLVTPLQNHHQ